MKKLFSFILCILCLFAWSLLPTSAVSIDSGLSALQNTFTDGKGINFDYVLYSPVKGSNDKTKYPVIIWLHGQFSSTYERHQLNNSDIALWAADENQEKIRGTGGAFIYLPRDPSIDIAWSGESAKLKKDLDLFIEEYGENVDTDRIYIGGYSMGGRGTYRIAAAYPDFFAAIYLLSPVYNPTNEELRALKDMPVWVTSCKSDVLVSHSTIESNWNYLNQYSNAPHKNRWSLFTTLYKSNGSLITNPIYITHDTWNAAAADLFMDDGTPFKGMTTTNGNGYPVKLNYPEGLLYWLSSQGYTENGNEGEGSDGSGSSGNIQFPPLTGNIFQKILQLFRRMIEIIMS